MIIRLKNKYQLALAEIVQECKEKGGIPNYIEVTPNEAWDILKEMNCIYHSREFDTPELNHNKLKEMKNTFRVKMNNSEVEDARFIIHSDRVNDYEVATKLVKGWWSGDFSVYYQKPILTGNDEIEIRVVQPKTVKVKTENEGAEQVEVQTTPKTHIKAKHDPKSKEIVDKDSKE